MKLSFTAAGVVLIETSKVASGVFIPWKIMPGTLTATPPLIVPAIPASVTMSAPEAFTISTPAVSLPSEMFTMVAAMVSVLPSSIVPKVPSGPSVAAWLKAKFPLMLWPRISRVALMASNCFTSAPSVKVTATPGPVLPAIVRTSETASPVVFTRTLASAEMVTPSTPISSTVPVATSAKPAGSLVVAPGILIRPMRALVSKAPFASGLIDSSPMRSGP